MTRKKKGGSRLLPSKKTTSPLISSTKTRNEEFVSGAERKERIPSRGCEPKKKEKASPYLYPEGEGFEPRSFFIEALEIKNRTG